MSRDDREFAVKGSYPGLNIQYPISQLILSGKKTVETRTYTIPSKYVGLPLLLIETPGHDGNFAARIQAIIIFGPAFLYKSKSEFYRDSKRHCVFPDSPWAWQESKPKWGWPIVSIQTFKNPIVFSQKKGIRFTKKISLNTLNVNLNA
jgi:hypothetical protein